MRLILTMFPYEYVNGSNDIVFNNVPEAIKFVDNMLFPSYVIFGNTEGELTALHFAKHLINIDKNYNSMPDNFEWSYTPDMLPNRKHVIQDMLMNYLEFRANEHGYMSIA